MKSAIIALLLILPLFVSAQGAVYVSNLENPSVGSAAIGSDSWIAQEFDWGGLIVNGVEMTPPAVLNSVQLLMEPASGSPTGFTVSIYSSQNNSLIGDSLGTLSGPTNPSSSGICTYTTPGITLSPATSYFVVVTSGSMLDQGAYNWSATTGGNQMGNSNFDDVYYSSVNGTSWNYHFRQDIFQMAIYATPSPKPFGLSFVFLGAAISFCVRTHNKT